MNQRYDEASSAPVDPTTQLYRLGAGGPSLTAGMAAAHATGRRVALLHIDIDYFDAINQNMGDAVGDQTLAAAAQRLLKAMPRGGWLWRLSSDEFIAGIAYRPGERDGAALADMLRDAFEKPLLIPPYELPLTVSIGIAVYPDHAGDAASLLAAAESALRNVKSKGLGSIGLYAMATDQAEASRGFAARFLAAVDNSELQLYYQPVIDAQDGGLTGFSALLRWNTAEHGQLRPSQFLATVERMGLSARMGAWVVEAAARQAAAWRAQGQDYLTLSLHLGSSLLEQPGCLDQIGELLHRYNVPASALEFEVSEVALVRDARLAHATLTGLRALGASVTVQDFGLGGLNFAALAHYPLDRLKIDRSFFRSAASDPRGAAIVCGIIAMGHRLGMKVIAKGVESEAELGFLRRNHCDYFLGYLVSPPLPADEVDDLVRRRFLLPGMFASAPKERTLLLLDDETNVLRSLVRLFRRERYKVLTASSVSEAFDLLASNPVQVIVSDQRMPEMSGTEFLTRVRDLYPQTMRMVLSGYIDLATITEAINLGAIYRFQTKPWDDEELRGHVRAAFREHERRAASVNGH